MARKIQSIEALPRPVKKIIKTILPRWLVKMRKKLILHKLKDRDNKIIFTSTYQNYRWGRKNGEFNYYSGDGSHDLRIISGYVEKISIFLKSLNDKTTVIDIGCGDFNIGSRICAYVDLYIACDVVDKVINFNESKFNFPNVKFQVLDASKDQLPNGNVVILRQVLQHLSNSDIQSIIFKISHGGFKYLILTDHQPLSKNWKPNLDKPTGPNIRAEFNSGLNLVLEPFNLNPKEIEIIDEVEIEDGYIRTFIYTLI